MVVLKKKKNASIYLGYLINYNIARAVEKTKIKGVVKTCERKYERYITTELGGHCRDFRHPQTHDFLLLGFIHPRVSARALPAAITQTFID